ncbi:phosphoribosylamine--glycine ligase [Methylacidimicrobium tartarophylax]|uniref:Phosphoribosylamine--glycine ligase n=1 Tax=Methylacidimicrobium tartarophylax TaxID=1041768 RepID=A0A5E6M920_9BACT|nr:phosphoribosylamine--glycine ligase [Methylacidimicrobium tartarophylax]VVM05884.1 phosphoribosylamine---glycine ligase [Methylacidimicrobium tartarophylax]
MKVLVIGGGSREHALCWSLRQDPEVEKLYAAPGNAGTALHAENLPIAADDIDSLSLLAQELRPDLTVVGPEAPLCAGITDAFGRHGLSVFGPSARSARLEGSKVWTKDLAKRYGIPTAEARSFDDPREATSFSRGFPFPQVIKADGLASGKGVFIVTDFLEAQKAIASLMDRRLYGAAGQRILIEAFLEGVELSAFALFDANQYSLLGVAHDYKRIDDGDRGPNTGGMGAFLPSPFVSPALLRQIEESIFSRLHAACTGERLDYRGVLYAGLMITQDGPFLLEINVRLGDPEAQVLLPTLKTPLSEIAGATCRDELGQLHLLRHRRSVVGVVISSSGYPENPRLEDRIILSEAKAPASERQGLLFYGATKQTQGILRTSGGRVFTAVGWGDRLAEARKRAYEQVNAVTFPDMHFRKDIASFLAGRPVPEPEGEHGLLSRFEPLY